MNPQTNVFQKIGKAHFTGGFTLAELMVATAVFLLFAVVSVYSFMQLNRMASVARYQTLALSLAQQKMDQLLTVQCTGTGTGAAAAANLLLNGTTITSSTETGLQLNNDPLNTGTLTTTLSGATAASALDTVVLGTGTTGGTLSRVTQITPVSSHPNLLNLTVTVSYQYLGRPYSVQLSSIRATDNF